MDTRKRTFAIENGPSSDRLFDAVKYAYDEEAKVKVSFGISGSNYICTDDAKSAIKPTIFWNFKLIGICHESGNNCTYLLKGYAVIQEDKHRNDVPFEAFYDSRLRKGSLTLLS